MPWRQVDAIGSALAEGRDSHPSPVVSHFHSIFAVFCCARLFCLLQCFFNSKFRCKFIQTSSALFAILYLPFAQISNPIEVTN